MFIKVCANTNLEDALLVEQMGADALGFVFAPSKRQVTVEQVAAITSHLSEGTETVGVFTTTDAAEILDATKRARLTTVQLHSAFDPKLVDSLRARAGFKVLQVVDVADSQEAKELEVLLRATMAHPGVHAVLLDASHGGASGGTGKTFDWERRAETLHTIQQETGAKVIVAGGLRAENVGTAIAAFAPWGVDAASGVESVPGSKDPVRLQAFIEAAREAGSKIKV